MTEHSSPGHSDHPSGYEQRDTNVGKIVLIAVLTVLFVTVSSVVLHEYLVMTKEQLVYELVLQPVAADYVQLRAQEDSVLTTYALIDSATQTYRIPVDSAMKLVAAEAASQ